MSLIIVEGLAKSFSIAERDAGWWGAVRGLVARRYRTIHALAGVDFRVVAGELVGLIGPNGAGKSTLVKVLSGILVPDGGRCEIGGRTPWQDRQAHVAGIGVVFGQRTQLWWDLPVQESFALLRDIYRVPETSWRTTLDELIAMLALEPLLGVPVRQLSLGQRMRCDLVAALLHSPPLLFLDEPTIGLDVTAKRAVREFIRRLNRDRGITVIITSHDLDDLEAVCGRLMVIDHGRMLADGSMTALRATFGNRRRLVVDLADAAADAAFDHPGVRLVSREAGRLVFEFDPQAIAAPELIGQLAASLPMRDLTVEPLPIEDLVTRILEGAA